MATVLAIDNYIRVRHYCYESVAAQVGVNTMYYRVTSVLGASVTDVQAATALADDFDDFYAALMPATSTYQNAGVAIMIANQFRQLTSEVLGTGNPLPGTAAGTQMPLQASFLITLRTGSASRSRRGRIYPPFPASTFQNANGLMTAAAQVVLQQLAAACPLPVNVVVGGNGVTLEPQVRGRSAGAGPFTPLYTPIASAIGRSRFATQRRRGQYGRQNVPPA